MQMPQEGATCVCTSQPGSDMRRCWRVTVINPASLRRLVILQMKPRSPQPRERHGRVANHHLFVGRGLDWAITELQLDLFAALVKAVEGRSVVRGRQRADLQVLSRWPTRVELEPKMLHRATLLRRNCALLPLAVRSHPIIGAVKLPTHAGTMDGALGKLQHGVGGPLLTAAVDRLLLRVAEGSVSNHHCHRHRLLI